MTFATLSFIILTVMRKCPACQQLINPEAKFCNFCGQKQTVPPANHIDLTDKKFFSQQELETLDLSTQNPETLSVLFNHSNKYLVRRALEIFLGLPDKKTTILRKYFQNADFLAILLDMQLDSEELFSGLWTTVSTSPWLVHKYLVWAKNKKYKLNTAAAEYLEAAADEYLQRALKN